MVQRRVLLAFSGGIDSCAAVEILRLEGWQVELLTIDMLGDEVMMQSAREAAARVGATLHTIDAREIFNREIIANFISEYCSGRTPAPCTRCNPLIKWRLLAQKADELGIYHIATGHYFKVSSHNGHHFVTRARDPRKDQSYYLWGVEERILRRAVTPMGDKIKEEVKRHSEIKRESMGICFLKGDHYSDFLTKRCGTPPQGDIINSQGEVIGRHNGVANYTIGQRRGEGIPQGERVVAIEGERNRVVVGSNEQLYTSTIEIGECHFIDPREVCLSQQISVMVRGIGRNPEGYARVETTSNGAKVELLDDPAWAVASGQPMVLYIGDRVVGGGFVR